jgi:hypothetical protein
VIVGLFSGKRGGGSKWDDVDYLDLVPTRRVAFEERPDGGEDADGMQVDLPQVVLLVPRYRDAVWGRILQPRLGPGKRFVRVPLEARGSALWRGMDGKATVRDLLTVAESAAPGDGEDLARRVCLYLQALVDNGFVAVALPAGTERPGT